MDIARRQAHELEDAMDFPVEKLSSMTREQERQFWAQFERDLTSLARPGGTIPGVIDIAEQ